MPPLATRGEGEDRERVPACPQAPALSVEGSGCLQAKELGGRGEGTGTGSRFIKKYNVKNEKLTFQT